MSASLLQLVHSAFGVQPSAKGRQAGEGSMCGSEGQLSNGTLLPQLEQSSTQYC